MATSWFYRLFRLGRIPRRLAEQIDAEGSLFREEGVPMRITLRDVRAPGRYSSVKVSLAAGYLVATKERFLVGVGRRPMVDLGVTDPGLRCLECRVTDSAWLELEFCLECFRTDAAGSVSLRLLPDHPHEFCSMLNRAAQNPAIDASPEFVLEQGVSTRKRA
ncbi:MAG: hypothetical protein KIS66_10905 [Fimbriimonadaceae bacterium]|nr:hypothetical protein [Fimbriimonadaceae bacterium]